MDSREQKENRQHQQEKDQRQQQVEAHQTHEQEQERQRAQEDAQKRQQSQQRQHDQETQQKGVQQGPQGQQKPEEKERHHQVAKGDTLSDIAKQYYGDGGEAYWRAIYNANRNVIGQDPDVLKPGQKLIIPPVGSWESLERDMNTFEC